jgi:hypothetical protein
MRGHYYGRHGRTLRLIVGDVTDFVWRTDREGYGQNVKELR